MLQSESSDEDLPLTCVSDLLDRKMEEEGRWGGPGHIRALVDDGVPPGPGEAEEEARMDLVIRRRLLMLEETMYSRGNKGGEGGQREGGQNN